MQHEVAPLHPAVAEHQREQPEDPFRAGLIGEDSPEMREVHLGLAPRRGFKADLEAGALTRPDLAQKILHRGIPTAVAEFADLAMQPAAGQLPKGSDAIPQVGLVGCQQTRSWRPGAIGRRLNAACDVFANRTSAQSCPSGNCRHTHAMLAQLQDHDQLPKPDHLRPPPNPRGQGDHLSGGTSRRRSRSPGSNLQRIEVFDFRSPDLERIHPAMTHAHSIHDRQ